jgi:hypothetical protein
MGSEGLTYGNLQYELLPSEGGGRSRLTYRLGAPR